MGCLVLLGLCLFLWMLIIGGIVAIVFAVKA